MNDTQRAAASGQQNRRHRAVGGAIDTIDAIDEKDTARGVDLVEIALRGSAHELLDRVQKLRERSSRATPFQKS